MTQTLYNTPLDVCQEKGLQHHRKVGPSVKHILPKRRMILASLLALLLLLATSHPSIFESDTGRALGVGEPKIFAAWCGIPTPEDFGLTWEEVERYSSTGRGDL